MRTVNESHSQVKFQPAARAKRAALAAYMEQICNEWCAEFERTCDGIIARGGTVDNCLAFLDRLYAQALRSIELRRRRAATRAGEQKGGA
jgi:hypothetical protein